MIVYLNGRFVPEEHAYISVHDRGFLYGDGLFEAVRVYDGKPFLWSGQSLCLQRPRKHLPSELAGLEL